VAAECATNFLRVDKVGIGLRSVTAAASEVRRTEVRASDVICCKRVTYVQLPQSEILRLHFAATIPHSLPPPHHFASNPPNRMPCRSTTSSPAILPET